jgi:transposase
MEDVLDLLAKPYDEREPVVTLDERPVQLLDSARPGIRGSFGRIARRDYEYVRRGTANIYCIVEPKAGRHLTHATRDRKRPRFAAALQRIADEYPTAKTIHLVMDNLNIHDEKSVRVALGDVVGANLWSRFTAHYTPKHASWLNPAEIEASLWSRECLGRDRIPTLLELRQRTRAWNARANRQRRTITWRFTTQEARRVFRYRRRITTSRSEH